MRLIGRAFKLYTIWLVLIHRPSSKFNSLLSGAAPYMKKGKGDTPKACAGRNKGKEKEERKKEKKEEN